MNNKRKKWITVSVISSILLVFLLILFANSTGFFSNTAMVVLEKAEPEALAEEIQGIINEAGDSVKEIYSPSKTREINSEKEEKFSVADLGEEKNTRCPEMEQFYGGKCLDELNPFLRKKAEECLAMRKKALTLGIDWHKACGGSGGGGGGGSSGSGASGGSNENNTTDSGNNNSEQNNQENENNETGEDGKKTEEPYEPEEKYFGINESEISYFLEKKIEQANENCIGCEETFVNVSDEILASVPIAQTDFGTQSNGAKPDVSKKLKDSFLDSSKKTKVIIEVNSNEQILSASAKIKKLGGTIDFATRVGNIIVAEIPENIVNSIAVNSEIKGISKDKELSILLSETIPQINADSARESGYRGRGIRVAVIDTGVDSDHPMLEGRVIAQANFSSDITADDLQGHGTHIAGIIAGSSKEEGYNGVASEALIINAKAMNANGKGTISSIIQAISFSLNPDNDTSTNDGARIINMSLGAIGDFEGSPLENALIEAESNGVLIISSAGNCGYETPSPECGGYTGLTYPGSSAYVFTAGTLDENNKTAGFSSRGYVEGYGIKPDVTAPGVNITSSSKNGSYSTQSGTSMSAGVISGVASLILEKNPLLLPSEVKNLIASSALDLGVKGKDELYGFGLIDANKALAQIDLVNSKTIAFTGTPTTITIGTEDEKFNISLRLFNRSNDTAKIREHVCADWLFVGYPREIFAGNSAQILISADQSSLSIGKNTTELLIAIDDYILSHTITLNVVEGTTDYNTLEEFEIEISKPVSVRAEGTSPQGEIGRGKEITLIAKYNNPIAFDSDWYKGALRIKNNSYLCDTAPQEYWQPATLGKDVSFSYAIPTDAPLGYYNITALSWMNCSGQTYDGSCHSSSSYSCETPEYINEYTASNVFKVIEGCTSGDCCNTTYNTFRPDTTVCSIDVGVEYRCQPLTGGALKGADVQYRNSNQYCSGSNATCNGLTEWEDEWQTYKPCESNQICDISSKSCVSDPVTCYSDADCGYSGWTGEPFCSSEDGHVMQDFVTRTCTNSGTEQSYCEQPITDTLQKQTCSAEQKCFDAACVVPGTDQCPAIDAGKSYCHDQTIETCYYDSANYSYKKLYESCYTGVCVDADDGAAYCDTTTNEIAFSIENAPVGLAVYKQPNDNFTINLKNNTTNTITITLNYDSNGLTPLNSCYSDSTITLSSGNNYCDFTIDSNASRKPYKIFVTNGAKHYTATVNVALPQMVILTDSGALKQRFSSNTEIDALMQKVYLRAFAHQGAVYDLAKYRNETGERPWSSFSTYSETIANPTIGNVNNYVQNISAFAKQKCNPTYCKHIMIVGDDFVVPQARMLNPTFEGQQIVFSDEAYSAKSTLSLGDMELLMPNHIVAFVVPDTIVPDSNLAILIGNIKNEVLAMENVIFVEEYKSSEIVCNNYLGHPLNDKMLVLIGTPENNNAIACERFFDDGLANYRIKRSVWVTPTAQYKNYAFILKQESLSLGESPIHAFGDDVLNGTMYGYTTGTTINSGEMVAACIGLTEEMSPAEIGVNVVCNTLPVIELVADAVDEGKCIAQYLNEGSSMDAADHFICGFIHLASAYDLAGYGAAIGSAGLALPGVEVIDVGLSTIKATLKTAVAPLGKAVLEPALDTLKQSPELIGNMALFIARRGDEGIEAVESSRGYTRLLKYNHVREIAEEIIENNKVLRWSSDAVGGLSTFLAKGGNWNDLPFTDPDKIKILEGIGNSENAFGKSAEHIVSFKIIEGEDLVAYDPLYKEIIIGDLTNPNLIKMSKAPHEYSHAKIIYEIAGGKSAKEIAGSMDYKYISWFDELNADVLAKNTLKNKDEFIQGIKIEKMAYENGTAISYRELEDLAQNKQFTELAYNKKMAEEIGDAEMIKAIDDLFKEGGEYNYYKGDFDKIYPFFKDYADPNKLKGNYEKILNEIITKIKETGEAI